ncbi:PREDICTED: uncharacterized protein LOC105570802, partial [Vollenhovia emeryi]|uniref:uncharacterized protein LOC105570802 n=1 Tax=Vollenhovia emeryi TaxID=411798 RepID=UPI0005F44FAA
LFFSYYLFSLVGPSLQKTSFREPLPPKLRLVVTLSYLASGDSPKYLSKYYRIGASTIYKVIQETCENIWQALAPLFLKAPTVEKWNEIAEHFYNRWNLPNCVGSIDGKHIRIQCPPRSGSEFFNNENGSNGIVTQGTWRDTAPCLNLNNISRFGSNNATRTAITQRTTLAEWMLTDEGQVPWQFQIIRGCDRNT